MAEFSDRRDPLAWHLLLPSVCAGREQDVRAILRIVAAADAARQDSVGGLSLDTERVSLDSDDDEETDTSICDSAKGLEAPKLLAPAIRVAATDEHATIDDGSHSWLDHCVNFCCPYSGRSLLEYACHKLHWNVAEVLLTYGADPNGGNRKPVHRRRCYSPPDHPCLVKTVVLTAPLDQAVWRRHVEAIRLLVRRGAKVTVDIWQSHYLSLKILFSLWNDGSNPLPISIAMKAFYHLKSREQKLEFDRLINRYGTVSWSLSHIVTWPRTELLLFKRKSLRYLLLHPAYTPLQRFLKTFFLQRVLLWLCSGAFRDDMPEALDEFIDVLLFQGASIHGWSYWHSAAMTMCFVELLAVSDKPLDLQSQEFHSNSNAWSTSRRIEEEDDNEDLEHIRLLTSSMLGMRGAFDFWKATFVSLCISCQSRVNPVPYGVQRLHQCFPFNDSKSMNWIFSAWEVQPLNGLAFSKFLLPFSNMWTLPAVLCQARNANEELKQVILHRTNLPWLSSLEQLPLEETDEDMQEYFGRVLHDGPSSTDDCLDEDQRRITLAMCTGSGCKVRKLKSLSRDAVLASVLLSTNDTFRRVQQLPLPRSLKDYLLGS